MTAVAARPEEISASARALAGTDLALREASRRCRAGADECAPAWQGAAALAQAARTRTVEAAATAAADQLAILVDALQRFATQCEAEQSTIRNLRWRRAEATRERDALSAAPIDPADLLRAAQRAARLAELDNVIWRLDRLISDAEDRLEGLADTVESLVRHTVPPWLPGDLEGLGRTLGALASASKGGRLAVNGAMLLSLAVQHARNADLAGRLALVARMHPLFGMVTKAPSWAKLLGRFGPLAIPLTVWSSAVPDVHDGGGYSGWRGAVTRVSAGVAAAGSVAMLVPHPWVAGAGAVSVGAYVAWKAGNTIYDNREAVAHLAGMAWEEAQRRAAELGEVVKVADLLPWGPLGPVGPVLRPDTALWAFERGRDALELGQEGIEALRYGWDDLLEALPGGAELPEEAARQVRRFGDPVGMPDVPVAPGIRLPVVPIGPWRWPVPVSLPVSVPVRVPSLPGLGGG